ncbi:unnamed protein product, partial [Discosporangium mesarthrocarpum]
MPTQTLWCLSFRAWARDAGLLWLPTLMLGGAAVALGGAQGVLRDAWYEGDMGMLEWCLTHLPLSLHFGWVSCASLVNLNGFLAYLPGLSNGSKLAASVASISVAVALALAVAVLRGESVVPGVIAWALASIASKEG